MLCLYKNKFLVNKNIFLSKWVDCALKCFLKLVRTFEFLDWIFLKLVHSAMKPRRECFTLIKKSSFLLLMVLLVACLHQVDSRVSTCLTVVVILILILWVFSGMVEISFSMATKKLLGAEMVRLW